MSDNGDGIPEEYELANGLDPSVHDGALDKDGDGLTNKREFDLGTRADLPDTDGDGLGDQVESNTGTDPLRDDTDGDGLGDQVEING